MVNDKADVYCILKKAKNKIPEIERLNMNMNKMECLRIFKYKKNHKMRGI